MSEHLPGRWGWGAGVTEAERFWAKVNFDGPIQPHMDTPCWEWTAYRVHGYGQFTYSGKRNGRAHRFVWELCAGPIPDGICVCHVCDNRACVRMDHLFLGDKRANNVDMVEKGRGRWKGECKRGHDMSVYGVVCNKGRSRRCGKCQKELRHA